MAPITEEQGDRLERAVYETVTDRAIQHMEPLAAMALGVRTAMHIGYNATTETEVMIAVCEVMGY